MKCHSNQTHYLDVFFFTGSEVSGHHLVYYETEEDALKMFQRGVNKYKGTNIAVLIGLRDKDHVLLKCERLNYVEILSKKK